MGKVTDQPDLNQITQQIKALANSNGKQAGQNDIALNPDTIEAINGVFLLMSANYGNQYNAAYPNTDRSNIAKRLWAKHLNHYPKNVLMAVADQVVGGETFLPALAKFKEYCDKAYSLFGLPDARSAYIEACRAPQPKSTFAWSHPAIYYAGKATDWFFLSSESERTVLPVFKRNYEILCDRVIKGETLAKPMVKALPEEVSIPLSKKENQQHLADLKKSLGL
jgi:hypothetical protein